MAKVSSVFGSAKGKLAGVVYAVRAGEQIARAYQPNVANPQTTGQVENRAKLKLLSQLSAAMAPALAFKAKGLVSARNQFTSHNYKNVVYNTSTETAEAQMSAVDLTGGIVGLPLVGVRSRTADAIELVLNQAAPDIDFVVYTIVAVSPIGAVRVLTQKITQAGADENFDSGNIALGGSYSGYVYAYGVRFNDSGITARYRDMVVTDPVAALAAIISEKVSNVTLTQTTSVDFEAFSA